MSWNLPLDEYCPNSPWVAREKRRIDPQAPQFPSGILDGRSSWLAREIWKHPQEIHLPAMSPFLPHGHQRLFMGWPWETEGKVHEAGTCQGSLGTPGGNTKGEVPERWGQSSQRTLTSPSNVHPGHSPRGPQGPHL